MHAPGNKIIPLSFIFDTPFFGLQHREIEIDKFQVACGCSIVTSPKFSIEDFRHSTDTGMNFNTHF